MTWIKGKDATIGCILSNTNMVIKVVDLWDIHPKGPGVCSIEFTPTDNPLDSYTVCLTKEDANQLGLILTNWIPKK